MVPGRPTQRETHQEAPEKLPGRLPIIGHVPHDTSAAQAMEAAKQLQAANGYRAVEIYRDPPAGIDGSYADLLLELPECEGCTVTVEPERVEAPPLAQKAFRSGEVEVGAKLPPGVECSSGASPKTAQRNRCTQIAGPVLAPLECSSGARDRFKRYKFDLALRFQCLQA